jgi:AGZA family xanthine/uracil permease-like MFS transporter
VEVRHVSSLNRLFALEERGTTVGRELRGGVATFLTMAYILFANPAILSAGGVPIEAAAAATAAAAAICSILMGLGANFPVALAPGMGLNAIVALQIAPVTGSWQTAMGLVVLDGLVVLLLVLAGLREAVMNAIPIDMRRAIGAGIGLFIAFIGAVNARLVIVPAGTVALLSKDPGAILPPVTHGTLVHGDTAIAVVGLIVMGFLVARRVSGAIVGGILLATAIALVAGVAPVPEGPLLRMPRFDTILAADVAGALTLAAVPLLLSLVMVDFFDTIGTLTAIADRGGLAAPGGAIPRLNRLLAIDAISASIGGALGASSTTSYVESAAGVAEGARTGLHSVFVGLLFFVAMFGAPLMAVVPPAATAPALIVVGFLLCEQIARIDFTAIDTALPAFLIFALIPLTYSISHGIGYGFIAHVAIRLVSGRGRELHPLMVATALAFALFFVFG